MLPGIRVIAPRRVMQEAQLTALVLNDEAGRPAARAAGDIGPGSRRQQHGVGSHSDTRGLGGTAADQEDGRGDEEERCGEEPGALG